MFSLNELPQIQILNRFFHEKTSTKGISSSKCDVGNWIFSNFLRNCWEIFLIFLESFGSFSEAFFRRNFLGEMFLRIFCEDFFGRLFWEEFFGKNFLGGFFGGFFWEDFFGRIFLGGFFWEDFLGGILWEELLSRN